MIPSSAVLEINTNNLLHNYKYLASISKSSLAGATIANSVTSRLGFDQQESELTSWLIKNHLLMSDIAQKRDLSEPKTIRDFANTVKSTNRLRLLTVLTVCDIRGVGPDVWNNWKAVMIRTLFLIIVNRLLFTVF